eukprot:357713-Chlamydomonas_euryale.AAC.4
MSWVRRSEHAQMVQELEQRLSAMPAANIALEAEKRSLMAANAAVRAELEFATAVADRAAEAADAVLHDWEQALAADDVLAAAVRLANQEAQRRRLRSDIKKSNSSAAAEQRIPAATAALSKAPRWAEPPLPQSDAVLIGAADGVVFVTATLPPAARPAPAPRACTLSLSERLVVAGVAPENVARLARPTRAVPAAATTAALLLWPAALLLSTRVMLL